MLRYILSIGVLALGFFACKNDASTNAAVNADAVQEIKKPEGPNAELVRNPASAQGLEDTVNVAKMEFSETVYDFGKAKQGAVVEHTFPFTNTGKVPLTISNARSTCGCTVPEWPKEPIAPGESGVISARFNTEGKSGNQNKVITITANTYPSSSTVAIRGVVDVPANKKPAKKKQ